MKLRMELMKNLTMLTQFGISLITPTLLCLVVSWLLYARVGLGGWVFVPGFLFGLGSSAMVAWKLYIFVMKQEERQQKQKRVSYNKHE